MFTTGHTSVNEFNVPISIYGGLIVTSQETNSGGYSETIKQIKYRKSSQKHINSPPDLAYII